MILLILLFIFTPLHVSAVDPFSKISITSHKATCERSEKEPHLYVFTYQKNVKVKLADGSIIRSKTLEIELHDELALDNKVTTTAMQPLVAIKGSIPNSKKVLPKAKNQTTTHFKKITFNDNVRIKKGHRIARANSVEVYPDKNECLLKGNVVIKQSKKEKKQVPLITRGDLAILNLKTYHVSLEGSSTTPVTTTIHLRPSNPEKKKLI